LQVPYYRDDILLKNFGTNLKKIRLQKKISQEELSYQSDLDISQIGRIERGSVNTSICVIQRIAKALNIEMKELFDFEID
jgi:transcriptional regulator with XRE-family HTH domain